MAKIKHPHKGYIDEPKTIITPEAEKKPIIEIPKDVPLTEIPVGTLPLSEDKPVVKKKVAKKKVAKKKAIKKKSK